MDQYFDVTKGRAQAKEQQIRDDFVVGGARSSYHFGDDSYAEENPSTWIPEDQIDLLKVRKTQEGGVELCWLFLLFLLLKSLVISS